VVAKLFHLTEPDVACFGRKDIQQATLVRQMVRDLDWPLEVVVVPTVREADGLALSSRNAYLSPEERRRALVLSAALRAAHEAFGGGEHRAAALLDIMRARLAAEPEVTIEYIALVEPRRLEPVEVVNAETVVALAARVGRTRLIDNIVLGEGLGP
jgi:pantoate--beta-alanine ligase